MDASGDDMTLVHIGDGVMIMSDFPVFMKKTNKDTIGKISLTGQGSKLLS